MVEGTVVCRSKTFTPQAIFMMMLITSAKTLITWPKQLLKTLSFNTVALGIEFQRELGRVQRYVQTYVKERCPVLSHNPCLVKLVQSV